MNKTLYELLGLPEMATENQIYQALKTLENECASQDNPQSQARLAEVNAMLSEAKRTSCDFYSQTHILPDHAHADTKTTPHQPLATQNTLFALLQNPAFLAFSAAIIALLVYGAVENARIRQQATVQLAQQQEAALAKQQASRDTAQQAEIDTEKAAWQDKLIETSARLVEQALVQSENNAQRRFLNEEEWANRRWQLEQQQQFQLCYNYLILNYNFCTKTVL